MAVKIERGNEHLFTFEVDGRRFALWVGAPDEGKDSKRLDIAIRADDEKTDILGVRVKL